MTRVTMQQAQSSVEGSCDHPDSGREEEKEEGRQENKADKEYCDSPVA